jgi:hypothetical protein
MQGADCSLSSTNSLCMKNVLKVAVQDIGQLTDFDRAGRSPPSGRDDDLGGDQRSRFRDDDRGYSPAAHHVAALRERVTGAASEGMT